MSNTQAGAFNAYTKQLAAALKLGNSTEHTHRPALKTLLEGLEAGLLATNEPKRINCGAPDYIVTRKAVPLGYVEAKDVGIDLDVAQDSEQIRRYRSSLRNLILTDYLEFRLFRNGDLVQTSRLGKLQKNGVVKVDQVGVEQTQTLLTWFIQADVPSISSSQELARRMAWLAQLIRDLIRKTFIEEELGGELHAQFAAFQKILIADLEPEDFADMYAQTLCYGLFAARCNHSGKGFIRQHAASELPKTNPFLRKLFSEIAGIDLDERIAWAVDDLAELLARADMGAILEDFGKATRREDPVVHFYETFLSAYDPKLRELRGVYYTPEPVVGYIVRSIDAVLKKEFRLADGLADSSKVTFNRPVSIKKRSNEVRTEKVTTHKVQILDPAAGTGTFLYEVIGLVKDSFKGNAGLWQGYVSQHLLPRLFGFELLMAPYAVGHMKLGLELRSSGYAFDTDERLRLYLTNTLEEAHQLSGLPLFTQWLAEEATRASDVKRDVPIMVVLGNPPYSGHSANAGEWINGLLRGIDSLTKKPTGNYFQVDGKDLGEKNPKWLNDDYVKFIRFAQWRIEQTGYGVLAYITNHGYLDNPTFRGMRQSLLTTFDELHVLNLHGNAKRGERAPGGGKDENVFDIQQGVAIGVFVKRGGPQKTTGRVLHSDLWGLRKAKYSWLAEHDIYSTPFKEVSPQTPTYLFVPQDSGLKEEWERGISVAQAFRKYNSGLITARDSYVFDFERKPLRERISEFAREDLGPVSEKYGLKDTREKTLGESQKEVRALKSIDERIVDCLYRPFDKRPLFYHGALVRWPVYDVMQHLLGGRNLALIVPKQIEIQRGWEHCFCTATIAQLHSVSIKEINYVFPLFLQEGEREDLFDVDSADGWKTNLQPEFIDAIASKCGLKYKPNGGDLKATFAPLDAFRYAYAILFSPTYRQRYAQFLKGGFPRIPITTAKSLFVRLSKLGGRLVDLHLMSSFGKRLPKFPIAGNNRVDKVAFAEGRVHINAEQYFDGVDDSVWDYHVGGFQVASKWLKDRKGRLLSHDECTNYMRIVAALEETLRIQNEIDAAIPDWPIS